MTVISRCCSSNNNNNNNNNTVALVRERTNRPSFRRLSTKLVPTFAERGVSRSQRGGSPTAVTSIF
jgi:hypothetical protein